MAGVVLLLRSIRPCESMHGNARTFSEQVIASIIDDSRCGMSDVAFRTTPPIGGPSCLKNMLIDIASLFHTLNNTIDAVTFSIGCCLSSFVIFICSYTVHLM